MRMSAKEPELAGNIIKEIIGNNLPVLIGYDISGPILESAAILPAGIGYKNNSVSWSFREHKGLRMGSTIWHQFSTSDDPEGSGIFDPRAYIFFEGDADNKWKPFPQVPDANTPASGGTPYEGYRDSDGGYGMKESVNYSPFNYFMIQDENFMPVILMTSAEVHFIKAEAYFKGIGVAMDKGAADNEYMNGIATSVLWWTVVSSQLKLPLSGIKFTDKITIPSELNIISVINHFGSWNATTEDEKLAYIYTQRWIDSFRQPWEAYAEARRTGLTPREGDAIAHFRLPYPPSESQYNTENWNDAKTSQGGEDPSVKMWWMP
jgi:hypothetical protein